MICSFTYLSFLNTSSLCMPITMVCGSKVQATQYAAKLNITDSITKLTHLHICKLQILNFLTLINQCKPNLAWSEKSSQVLTFKLWYSFSAPYPRTRENRSGWNRIRLVEANFWFWQRFRQRIKTPRRTLRKVWKIQESLEPLIKSWEEEGLWTHRLRGRCAQAG